MTTPTNLKTGTVDIGVNAYSKPVNTAAIEAVGAGMDMWASESKRRFNAGYEQDLENLRTLQESDPIVRDSVAASELMNKNALQGGLNDVDKKTLKDIERKYEDLDFLLEQGKTSWDMYRLRGSNMLRNAIMLRPDLGDEFRRIAANKLGTDVNNAYLEIWKEGQMRMENQTKGGKKDGGLSNATFETALKLSELDEDIKVQQANKQKIRTAHQKWMAGDEQGASEIMQGLSWAGNKNKAIVARDLFNNPTTQKDYADTLTRFQTLAKQSVLDTVAFEAEVPNLQRQQAELNEWRADIASDASSIIKGDEKEELLKRIDGLLTPINQLLSVDSDEERLNVIRNAGAVADFRLKPTATAVVSAINPYAKDVNADTVALVQDGLAIGAREDDKEFAGYVPTSAYIMNREQLNLAFRPVLVKSGNSVEKAVTTTTALAAMMQPYANTKVIGSMKVMHSPDQMYNLLQIFNSNNDELLARSQLLAKNNPILLEFFVGLRYGMITEMQKSRFSGLPQELKAFVEVPDLGETYKANPKGLPNGAVNWRISDKASPEQANKIRQWAKDNPPAKNAVGFQQFVDDTMTMAGRVRGAN